MNKNLICTVINNDYFIGGIILLYSLKKHNMFNNDIIVFYSSLTKESNLKKEYISFIKKYFNNVIFFDVTKDIYLKYKDKYAKMFSAFLCLEAILNENVCKYDKVCFLDCDMIVLNNINFIFDKMDVLKLNGSSNDCPHFNFYRGNDHINMINTGFMVYDNRIQQELSRKIVDFMNNFNGELLQWDQSIINKSLKNNFVNQLNWFCNFKPSPNELKEKKWNVIHYTGKFKPWNCFQSRSNPVNRNETFEMYKHIIYEWFTYVKYFSNELDSKDKTIYFDFLKNDNMSKIWDSFNE
jgi:alpha-N-acetylglucosamine transferase